MKKIILISSIISIVFLSSFISIEYPAKFDRKIDKTISKIWNLKSFKKHEISIPKTNEFELYSILNNGEILGYFTINKVNSCRIGGCEAPSNFDFEEGYEYFYYLSVFDKDLIIRKVQVLEYNAEYGFEICSKNWLKQFIGKTGINLNYSKDINAISGATISGKSITNNIHEIGTSLKKLREEKTI